MAKQSTTGRRLASLETTAEYLDVSIRTVRRYAAEGTITCYRIGGRLLRVDLNEVDQMLRQIPSAANNYSPHVGPKG